MLGVNSTHVFYNELGNDDIDNLQIEGPWLFVGKRFGPSGSGLRRYSLADGSLQVSYPGPGYAPPIKHVAMVGDRLFGVGNRGVEIVSGCPIPSALYELQATGAKGTVMVRQANGDRLVLAKDGFGFFNSVSGGGCGGHGNTGARPSSPSSAVSSPEPKFVRAPSGLGERRDHQMCQAVSW